MKTLRDTNNNNSNTTSSTSTRQNLITSNGSVHHNPTIADLDANNYSSLVTQNRLQQQIINRNNNGIDI
jgi:hypothetical protein